RDAPRCVLAHLAPRDARLPFRRAQPAFRHEPAEIRVTTAILNEEHEYRAVFDRQLRAEDEVQAGLACFFVRPDDAVHAVAIGEGERPEPEPVRFLDELVGMARAFQEREVALAPERDVHARDLVCSRLTARSSTTPHLPS